MILGAMFPESITVEFKGPRGIPRYSQNEDMRLAGLSPQAVARCADEMSRASLCPEGCVPETSTGPL